MYSQAVVDKWGLPATRVDAMPPSRDDLIRTSRQSLDVPAYPTSLNGGPLRDRAAAAGVRVLLTGFGGDDFFTGEVSRFELLREGRRVRLEPGDGQPDALRAGARPCCGPSSARAGCAGHGFSRRLPRGPRSRTGSARGPRCRFRRANSRQIHRVATSLVQLLGDEMEDRAAHAAGVDQRHPFYDRRVAEFGLALPARSSGPTAAGSRLSSGARSATTSRPP